jgi:prepilin-type N-terminal cleavage/methylation domain-containing protein
MSNNQAKKTFTLIELLIVIAIIGILATLLMPALSSARLKSQSAVCKSNLKQLYLGELLYSGDNEERIFTTFYGAEWMLRKSWVGNTGLNIPGGDFHDGNTGFLEPYCGDEGSSVYKCPATYYDRDSDVYRIDKGRSYEGFMQRNLSVPEKLNDVYFSRGNNRLFTNATRRPFFQDYTAEVGGASNGGNMKNLGGTTVHGNTGKTNLAVTDGSVIEFYLPTVHWSLFNNVNWVPYLERALDEDSN